MAGSTWWRKIGPGPLVVAAFIGPGTVTTCTLAGVTHGFDLLWAMLLSIIGTLLLQSMAARLGLVTRMGLAENFRKSIAIPWLRVLVLTLIFGAIIIGNAAYEAGNIGGGVLGLELLVGSSDVSVGGMTIRWGSVVIGLVAFALLYYGSYKTMEKIFIVLVIIMSFTYLVTAAFYLYRAPEILRGIFVPSVPKDSGMLILSIVGTTLVPYNLFLHASLVNQKWDGPEDIPKAILDTRIAIILGGLISMAIIIVAAGSELQQVKSAADLAVGLEPLLGSYAKTFQSIGLMAAGMTSAITAPLAAAYVAAGCFGWSNDTKATNFRIVWMAILLVGVLVSSFGVKLVPIIVFAQFTNGLLLPIIALFLIYLMNSDALSADQRNTKFQNSVGALLVLFTLLLGVRSLLKALGIW